MKRMKMTDGLMHGTSEDTIDTNRWNSWSEIGHNRTRQDRKLAASSCHLFSVIRIEKLEIIEAYGIGIGIEIVRLDIWLPSFSSSTSFICTVLRV
jgi:hypothetical protein